jgi:hypothetical protein
VSALINVRGRYTREDGRNILEAIEPPRRRDVCKPGRDAFA